MIRRILFILSLISLLAGCRTGQTSDGRPERMDQPDAADAYFAMKRTSDGTPSNVLYSRARAQMEIMPRYATEGDRTLPAHSARVVTNDVDTGSVGPWTSLGPGNIGGRTRALLIDPNNPEVMYAGATSGGVWKTIDAGAHWSPIGDELANLAVNSMAFDPSNSLVIYAGTGEGYFREDVRGTALPIRGNGIFATRDGGTSWMQLPGTDGPDFYWVNKLAVSPHDSQRIYAATRSGVWRSLDRGATWTNALPVTVKGGCLDLAFRADTGGDYLFASCGVFEQATVYRNTHAEGSESWVSVLSEPGMSRTSLAIAPSNPNVIYALAASNSPGPGSNFNQGLLALFRSDASGDPGSWSARVRNTDSDRLATLLLTNPISALEAECSANGQDSYVTMGWHCNVVAVDPTNPDRVWAAGVDLFRSDDGGRTWGVASYWWASPGAAGFVHADQHAIVFHPGYDGNANQTLFATNDGGIFRTDNANSAVAKGSAGACAPTNTFVHWVSLDHGYRATQFYHGAVSPDGTSFLGGAQDNSTLIGSIAAGPESWQMAWGGDGGYVAIDPTNPQVLYAEAQFGAIAKSTNGGAEFKSATRTLNDGGFLFVTPFLIDPNQHDRLWTGGLRLWRSDNAAAIWTSASQSLINASVSAIAVALGRPGRVIAGTNAGDILRNDQATTATGTTAWSMVRPRDGYVSSLTFDPTNADVAYATYAGFGGTHVWRSDSGGASWTPLDGSGTGALPDIPAHSVAVDPTRPARLYLGTDLGIFVTLDGGAHWSVENSGFTNVITEVVVIGQGARGPAVYAFTHGRGAWRAELTAAGRRRAAQ
ncbi:MAG TPA: hypothetical protein VEZ11_11500 [Thermoanaerobaculia bacterium]|nr:hypothetical protein [Thermoanaerobaculia bacterium]